MRKEAEEIASRKAIGKLARAFGLFRTVNPTMPIQLAQTLLLVALHEGASLAELTQLAGAKKATMSRHLLDLADRDRNMGPGLGLVDREADPTELRRNMYTLTPKGKLLIKSIVDTMKEA